MIPHGVTTTAWSLEGYATEVMQGVTEALCYGAAVIVSKP